MSERALEWGGFALVLAIGLFLAATGSGYVAQTAFNVALYVLLATGWNIISGFTGYVSFGQVSFFGLGAYLGTIAVLQPGLAWYLALPVAALGAAAVAAALGAIMLRLNGIFFALGMFGLARILEILARSLSFTGGSMGESVSAAASPNLAALVMMLAAAAAVVGTWAMLRTRFGLRLLAIRDDPIAAQAAGVDVWATKIIAFSLSAALAAVGGALYVWNIGYLDPSSAFTGTIELQTILMVMTGGIATVWGPLIGAVLVSALSTALWARFPMEQQIVLGALIMFVAVAMPGGIMSALAHAGVLRRRPIWGPPPLPVRREASPPAPSRASPILECSGLGIRFGGVIALEHIDLASYPAEMLAIIGPNGAGKSTLFNLISSFARPTAGTVRFAGRALPRMRPEHLARAGIARTFQTSRLFPSLTAWETVLLAAISLHREKASARAEASYILARLGLADSWSNRPDTLPPGRQRLLEIARALALRPKVLLLDEAMAGMSSGEIEEVHAALTEAMRAGTAIIAIEHVLPAIAPLAARVQVLDFGRTIAVGIPHDVLNDPGVIAIYLGAEETADEDAAA